TEVANNDATIKEKVTKELMKLYRITKKPVFQQITRWEHAIPQYDEATDEVDALLNRFKAEGIYHCTNWKDGVSVADCMKKGKALAETLAKK
ncbi:MAG: hypothetical protein AAGI07_20350, partial [Bacteroidota bacterium]